MTREQREKVSNLLGWFAAVESQKYLYGWESTRTETRLFDSFVQKFKEINIDFNNLTREDCIILGCSEHEGNMLIPLYLHEIIPDNTVVYGVFSNQKYVVGIDRINNDNRAGMLAWCFKPVDGCEQVIDKDRDEEER